MRRKAEVEGGGGGERKGRERKLERPGRLDTSRDKNEIGEEEGERQEI